MSLANFLKELTQAAPEDWERSVIFARKESLNVFMVSIVDVRYREPEKEEDPLDLERIISQQAIANSDLRYSASSDSFLRSLLEAMEREVDAERNRRQA